MSNFLSQLEWRNAEKHFDASKPLEEDLLNKILAATRMAPSSYGIQPYHIYVVSNAEMKTKLRAEAFDQAQFTDAPYILVFASRNDFDARIDGYFETASGGDAEAREKLKGYEDMMRGRVSGMPEEEKMSWAHRQTYIALGFAMAAVAETGVASCPMEGFNTAKFDELLGLPAHMKSVVTLSLGYGDGTESRPKVRFPENDLFTHV
ncbi:NAD(P)H-dependent oxidoreductase [Candidatus Peregrinibacteria bacterium]|nr:NAD(P)H-dependent oxidoreductase [Candidatus Peregrinibacteria bacterium]